MGELGPAVPSRLSSLGHQCHPCPCRQTRAAPSSSVLLPLGFGCCSRRCCGCSQRFSSPGHGGHEGKRDRSARCFLEGIANPQICPLGGKNVPSTRGKGGRPRTQVCPSPVVVFKQRTRCQKEPAPLFPVLVQSPRLGSSSCDLAPCSPAEQGGTPFPCRGPAQMSSSVTRQ